MRQKAKETPINIRAKALQLNIIDRAACRETQDVLLDQHLFIADENQYDAFIQAMETPLENHEKLNSLTNRKSPWE